MSEPVPTTNFSASWTRVDETTDPSFYAKLLQATRAEELERARTDPAAAFGALGLRPGLRLLDVGCGTGDYLRVMAPLVAPGQAVGIDLSTELVKRAELATHRMSSPTSPSASRTSTTFRSATPPSIV